MQTSDQINEIATALAKAQGEIKGAAKDSTNPHFKSSYADLSSVWDACRAALSKHGLSVIQTPDTTADGVFLYTTLAHSSGQWIRGVMPVRPVQDTPQGLGSALTYARRYSLASMVGVAPEDDDGQAASAGERTTTQRIAAPRAPEDKKAAETIASAKVIAAAIANASTAAAVDEILSVELPTIKAASATTAEFLQKKADERKTELTTKKAA